MEDVARAVLVRARSGVCDRVFFLFRSIPGAGGIGCLWDLIGEGRDGRCADVWVESSRFDGAAWGRPILLDQITKSVSAEKTRPLLFTSKQTVKGSKNPSMN